MHQSGDAQVHRFGHLGQVCVSGHQHHGELNVGLPQSAQQVQAVQLRHADVQQDRLKVGEPGFQQSPARRTRRNALHMVLALRQEGGHGTEELLIVIND